jgi:hypothetical protein
MRASVACLLLLATSFAFAAETDWDLNGHTKLAVLGQAFADGDESFDVESSLRLNFSLGRGRWSFETAYELFAERAERIAWSNDDARLFNLSDIIREHDKTLIAHRLDRLWLGYASEKTVLRFGRQALSWGNGLFFTPMDLVNPFNPASIDTEFKSGDDMLYAQYLRDNGDDLQAALVLRRNPADADVDPDRATTALKYHGFAGSSEYDLLLADSYGAKVLGAGGARSIGGAVWRADVVISDADGDRNVQLVNNLSYGWVWAGRNVSAALEYFYDDGTDYLAGNLLLEVSPLFTVTPTVLANVSDSQALLQLIANYSLADNKRLLGSLNLPVGHLETGPGAGVPATTDPWLAVDWSVFAQFAWYF